MAHFLVDDLTAAIAQCEANGGTVVVGPFDLAMSEETQASFLSHYEEIWGSLPDGRIDTIGRSAVVRDPNGVAIGLAQLTPWAEKEYAAGQLTDFYINEQSASVRAGRRFLAAEGRRDG